MQDGQPPAPAALRHVSHALLDRLVEAGGQLSEPALLRGIEQAAAIDWQAAAWVSERRYPERWARAPDRVTRLPDLLAELEPRP